MSYSHGIFNVVIDKYSDTIYILSKTQNMVDESMEQIQDFLTILDHQDMGIMRLPLLTFLEKKDIFLTIAKNRGYNSIITGSICQIILNNRLKILPLVLQRIQLLKNEDAGLKNILIEYVGKLDENTKLLLETFCKKLFQGIPVIQYVYNPLILLGVRIFVDDRIWDLSYQNITKQLGVLSLKDLNII